MERMSGILLAVSSLPSPYGIGTMGAEARAFCDFLNGARQRVWQVLPIGPTSYGDSPYQSFSTFAGNPYLIDLDELIGEGLIERNDAEACDWGDDPEKVDYGKLYAARFTVLNKAYEMFMRDPARRENLKAYCERNAAWLSDYALFMALKDHFDGKMWIDWPDGARLRNSAALEGYRAELSERVGFYGFTQHVFDRQWEGLKAYAHARGIRILGDLPIYVPLDSADVWAAPDAFLLDADRRPEAVAGVPPDYFTADGQLWGNPLYDWAAQKANGYAWWIKRMEKALMRFDTVRFDHFRGLASYWRVPYGMPTAKIGEWVTGPGMDFISALKAHFGELDLIAEDLGYLTPDVQKLLYDSGFPGMKVLQFAFDAREPSNYLPHTYTKNCVCYTGTHDNTTAAGWFTEAARDDAQLAVRYLGLNDAEGYAMGMVRGGMSSVADLFIAQMQDYLNLGSAARMNIPGTLGGDNWKWRMLKGACTEALAANIAEMTRMYGR